MKYFYFTQTISKLSSGGVIIENRKPIAFYSRKLTPKQINYTPTEWELLIIMESLKEFWTIILGHHITLYMDPNNLTYENFRTERVLRWRLLLEEYGPTIKYIWVPDIDAAASLSRLPLINSNFK